MRSYLYASDLMVWLWTILFKGQSCRAYNVGSEEAVNIATLAREVAAALSPEVGVEIALHGDSWLPCAPLRAVTARAREELGLRAEVPLREAIRQTHAWFSGNAIPELTARGTHA